jgi:hypothetical protein
MSQDIDSPADDKPNHAGRWVFGALMTLLAIYGLFAAANARDTGFYIFGLAMFLFGVLFVFSLIGKYTGSKRH